MAGIKLFSRDKLQYLSETRPKNLLFHTSVDFSEYIETVSVKSKENITQTLLEYCENYDLEYEDLAKLLTPSIREKIQAEMQDLGLLSKPQTISFSD